MMNAVKVLAVEIKGNRLEVFYQSQGEIQKYFERGERSFWIEYSEDISLVPISMAIIPFVCDVLPVVWLTDAVLEVDELDMDFYQSIAEFKKGYLKMYPQVDFKGYVQAGKLVKNEYCCGNESALFFSGGVDAFSTLIAHVKENPLFITLWGADIRHEDIVGWEHVARHVKETALKWGKNYTFAKTNFRYILNERLLNDLVRKSGYGYWYGFQHGIGIISHAAPLAYTHQIPLVYIASSYTKGGEIACASSPMIDNYVRMGMCRVANDQSDWTRQDKIRNICEYVRQTHGEVQLRVCWESSGGGNCCRCEKCSRTIFGILAEGENPLDYGFTYTSADFANICDNIRRHWIFSKVYIELWKDIQKRFVSNRTRIPYNKDLEWIYTYDFDKVNDNFRKRLLCLNQSIRKKLSPLKHYLFK